MKLVGASALVAMLPCVGALATPPRSVPRSYGLREAPTVHPPGSTRRRDALRVAATGVAAALLKPFEAHAGPPRWDPHLDFMVGAEKNAISYYEIVPSQQARSGKIDINNALVTDYKSLHGMYPHAAGLIASNGPYNRVAELYSLPGVTQRDRELFKRYESQLCALAPSRMTRERINARQST